MFSVGKKNNLQLHFRPFASPDCTATPILDFRYPGIKQTCNDGKSIENFDEILIDIVVRCAFVNSRVLVVVRLPIDMLAPPKTVQDHEITAVPNVASPYTSPKRSVPGRNARDQIIRISVGAGPFSSRGPTKVHVAPPGDQRVPVLASSFRQRREKREFPAALLSWRPGCRLPSAARNIAVARFGLQT